MSATAATQSTECGVGEFGVAPKVFTCGVTPRTQQKFGGKTLARSPNSDSDHSVDHSLFRAVTPVSDPMHHSGGTRGEVGDGGHRPLDGRLISGTSVVNHYRSTYDSVDSVTDPFRGSIDCVLSTIQLR